MIRAVLTFFLFTALAGGAFADAPGMMPMPKPLSAKPVPAKPVTPKSLPPKPASAPVSIQSWGVRNASCAEWTNACEVCSRDAAGKPQCSTQGIACTPKAMVCSKPK
jgi:hypothetical protein